MLEATLSDAVATAEESSSPASRASLSADMDVLKPAPVSAITVLSISGAGMRACCSGGFFDSSSKNAIISSLNASHSSFTLSSGVSFTSPTVLVSSALVSPRFFDSLSTLISLTLTHAASVSSPSSPPAERRASTLSSSVAEAFLWTKERAA
eukprot:CAMPEP_0182480514 /NCGR_PEP_ID=MMETSP1319-20130603/35874_1 /TAXON_ID=172717 /ORGANISM="Bolidomonas pacifica, Strain RCC208" /LENGTH=151 /DNA_ID=CAMNT_0024682019 /DNA_START=155 /DNA_END=610 /DNA_ORIENTATION=-